ncbi:MAG: RICIN domain-containing protein, partial [Mycobacterium sp.]|nr:RICIN domain-containing protein [Mycobacterium sp.]
MLHLVPAFRRLRVPAAALLMVAAAAGFTGPAPRSADAAAPAAQAVTQPSEPFDPSPIDGESYYVVNQASGLQMDLANAGIVENPRSFTNLSQRWAMTKLRDGNWKISNESSGRCLDTRPSQGHSLTVQAQCRVGGQSQEWSFQYVTNGYGTIVNAATHSVLDATGTAAGEKLRQSRVDGAATQGQLWLLRPAYFRGNDSSLQEKAEYDHVAANSASAPWWHDGYLPGQDLLQIFKNNGINMIRLRPASINTTVVH